MDNPTPDPAAFVHLRIIIGMVTGLSVARLLNGLARFVQHPNRDHIYSVHLGWSFFLLLSVAHFWWFEFALSRLGRWTFEEYIFVISYSCLYFFISALLYPDRMEEYAGFEAYFHARQKWLYGLLACLFVADIADTALKGQAYLNALGPVYLVRQGLLALLAVIATQISSRRYHAAFVIVALVSQVWWIVSRFNVLR